MTKRERHSGRVHPLVKLARQQFAERKSDRREFLRQLATPAFVERIVDRLMSWAGMSLERACKTAELALAEVDAAAVVRPSTSADSSWSVEVIRPAPTTGTIVSGRPAQDEPTFSSET